MKIDGILLDALRPHHFEAARVWRFANREKSSDFLILPEKGVPLDDLSGKIIGTQVELACGRIVWALLGNIDIRHPEWLEHYLTYSLFHGDRWFSVARYHDADYHKNGPNGLARSLGRTVSEIYPIEYDISWSCKTPSPCLTGKILPEPKRKLSREQLIKMAVL